MPINYALFPNPLSADEDSYIARVQTISTAELETILTRMEAAGTTVGRADMISTLHLFFDVIGDLLLEGYSVNTPTANYRPTIKGTFSGRQGPFNPEAHQVDAAVSAGRELRRRMRQNGRPQRQEPRIPRPTPEAFYDLSSDTRNHLLTPGGMARLRGYRLQVDTADPAQGIFLLPDGGATAVAIPTIGSNKPSELIFMLPADLPAGDYALEVRALLPQTSQMRNGRLPHTLTVPA